MGCGPCNSTGQIHWVTKERNCTRQDGGQKERVIERETKTCGKCRGTGDSGD